MNNTVKSDVRIIFESLSPNKNRRYWFIRTQGGDFFNEFIYRGFVALNYPELANEKLIEIQKLRDEKSYYSALNSFVNQTYASYPKKGFIVSQVDFFTRGFKKGDLIIIPGSSGYRFRIGEIVDDIFYIENNRSLLESCSFKLRKSVRWFPDDLTRSELSPDLLRWIQNRKAISNLDQFKIELEKDSEKVFRLSDKMYLTFGFGIESDIDLGDLGHLSGCLSDLSREFLLENGFDGADIDFKTKIKLQSPGDLLLFGTPAILVVLALLASFLRKSSTNVNWGEFKYESKGESALDALGRLIQVWNQFLEAKQDRKLKKALFEKALENMQFKDSPYSIDKVASLLAKPKKENNELPEKGNQN